MLQGGDFTHASGIGGESIYGDKFAVRLACQVPMLLWLRNCSGSSDGVEPYETQAFAAHRRPPHRDLSDQLHTGQP